MDRFDVRKQIMADLAEAGLVEKVEDYVNKVGHSERTDAVIEPKLSMQWFVKMKDLAVPALGGSGDRLYQICTRKIQEHLPLLDDQHQGLVYLPPAMVGTSDSGMVSSRRSGICSG